MYSGFNRTFTLKITVFYNELKHDKAQSKFHLKLYHFKQHCFHFYSQFIFCYNKILIANVILVSSVSTKSGPISLAVQFVYLADIFNVF